jgi:hypothetical protein
LAQAEIPPLEAAEVERTLKPLFNPRRSQARDHFEIVRSTAGHFLKLVYWPNAFESFIVTRAPSGAWAAAGAKVALQESWVGVSGEIQSSLWEAMTAQGTPPEMVYAFADLFGWRIDFLTEPRRGDTYQMIWKRFSGNGSMKDGDIVCAHYRSREKGDLYGYRLAGAYFDQEGMSLRGQFLRAPLAYRRISSRFSRSRFHPILRIWRPHHGIDYSAARGTPVVSIGDGVVIAKGWEGGLGHSIRVRHAGSYVSIYGHLSGFAKGLHTGKPIKQGQLVGFVGSTGLSTGPHLHFGVEQAGRLINFLAMKPPKNQKQVPAPERPHFKEIQGQCGKLFQQLDKIGGPLQPITR